MKFLADTSIEPSVDASGLHINVLEFVAIIINLWLVIVLSRRHPVPVGGHVFAVFANNTSALSWLRYASRSHRPLTSVVLLASPPPFCLLRVFRAEYRADISLDV